MCVAIISGFQELEMIGKDPVPVKVGITSEWPLHPWPGHLKSTCNTFLFTNTYQF